MQNLCALSVGVTSLVPGSYSIVTASSSANASFLSRSATRLVEGQSSLAAVPAGGWQYFDMPLRNVPSSSSYWASIVEVSGSTRVFAVSDGTFPSPSRFTRTPPAVLGVQLISYEPGSPGFRTGNGATLVVGVFGFTGAVFTITFGTRSTVVELLVSTCVRECVCFASDKATRV